LISLVTPHFHRRDQQQRREHRQQNVIRNKSEQMAADKGANDRAARRLPSRRADAWCANWQNSCGRGEWLPFS
jgi:hypothetical protein